MGKQNIGEALGLHPFLLWGDAFPFFVGADEVAAVKKAGLQGNVVDVVIRVQ